MVAVQTFFIESPPLHFEKLGQGGLSFRISFNLEVYQEKTPPQMFVAFLAENASVKCSQAPLSSQIPQTYIKSSTHV